MSMYNDYTFEVEAVHPSGLLTYQSGHATTQRKFKVPCQYAEEFALRLLGKYRKVDVSPLYESPILPAPFPFDYNQNLNAGQMNMVAKGFTINPIAGCCFNVYYTNSSDEPSEVITDPTAFNQLEKYYHFGREEEFSNDQEECLCEVVVSYEENPCDCLLWNSESSQWEADDEILPGTCVSVERNPAYEMFTLPNANLVWKSILDAQGSQTPLKADSYAYQIIPKADIIVHWHNVPIQYLAFIESHLMQFRGHVNQEEWGRSIICPRYDGTVEPPGSTYIYDYLHEPETILFVDWQEDRSNRTDAFGDNLNAYNMNTTTLKLIFKQKRVELNLGPDNSQSVSASDDDTGIAGWNHMFTDNDIEVGAWRRVVVKSTQQPIFPLRAFSDILYPDPLP